MSLLSFYSDIFVTMGQLEVGDKIDIYRGGELQIILTVQEISGAIVKAVARSGYVSRFKREHDGQNILPADPMAVGGYLHTGHPLDNLKPEAKQRYYDKVREL